MADCIRCDIGIALHKGTTPVFNFDQSIVYLPQIKCSPFIHCVDYNYPCKDQNQYTTDLITDDNLAEIWTTLSNFCHLVNSAADNNIKLSEQILLRTMGRVMYALLRMNFPTDTINEVIRLGLLAFCSHSFLARRGIVLPNDYLHKKYRICFEEVKSNSQLRDVSCPGLLLWVLMIGTISVFASETDDGKGWIEARLRLREYWFDCRQGRGLLVAMATGNFEVSSLDRYTT